MDDTVCRAITFINYNIPIRGGNNNWDGFAEYYTTGFFDRMYTKRVDCNYADEQLKMLWDYSIECIAKGDGRYAHQNVYCFSKDVWNREVTDQEFWDCEKHEEMLLTFVVFVQTNEYMQEMGGIQKQCQAFNEAVHGQLQGDGYAYSYVTVDKNDFVICIRSRDYKKTVNAIMKLHEAGSSVVYSYSVFGISKRRQMQISKEEYVRLNEQSIDSISLKGVANSTKIQGGASYTLDEKYISFCKKLTEELYEGVEQEKRDCKIYDILGDDDFRLIVRAVPLGNLIKQFGEGGMLDYQGDATQYTFYSTHLVLNTRDKIRQKKFQPLVRDSISQENRQLQRECYKAERCQKMQQDMESINQALKITLGTNHSSEKLVAAFHGICQLIQSLTALESAPTKKYDFLSLYYPMKTLISIIRKKIQDANKIEELAENDQLYDFIHKISMTLHGTLRTDIQFFQIRDFNATVHYAPAKIRAYYSFFVFILSAHFSEVSSEKNKHSYIFSPGMFRTIFVRQLFGQPGEKERLMLITVPERYLYFPKNLSIILAHEVGHLIGDAIRKRQDRHIAMLKCSYRALCLEIRKFVDLSLKDMMGLVAKNAHASELAFESDDFLKALLDFDDQESRKAQDEYCYYSVNSLERIKKVFRAAGVDFGCMTWNEYCVRLKRIYLDHAAQTSTSGYPDLAKEARNNFLFYEKLVADLGEFFVKFEHFALPKMLTIFHYLMSETVSDLLAILALGLTPMEYVSSLADEIKTAKPKQALDNGITKIRIDLVVSAAQNLQSMFETDRFLDQWKDGYRDLIVQCPKNSGVYVLALEAFGVKKTCIDKMKNIELYQSPFNYAEQVFEERIYDFLNDQVIYQNMCDYLVECGREYLKQLKEKAQYSYSRDIVSAAFRHCVDGSPVDLISQIDEFLANSEAEWKDRYF